MPDVSVIARAFYYPSSLPTAAVKTVNPIGPFDFADDGADEMDAYVQMLYRTIEWSIAVEVENSGSIELITVSGMDTMTQTWTWDMIVSTVIEIEPIMADGDAVSDETAFVSPVIDQSGEFHYWLQSIEILNPVAVGTFFITYTETHTDGSPTVTDDELLDAEITLVFAWGPSVPPATVSAYPAAIFGTEVFPAFHLTAELEFPTSVGLPLPFGGVILTESVDPTYDEETTPIDFVMDRETLTVPTYRSTSPFAGVDTTGYTVVQGANTLQFTCEPLDNFTYA